MILLLTLALADEPDKKAWDVQHPPGEPRTVDVDVTRGTWMSVDVHPSGDRLVFDLLGDLYELPIGGGEAKALTSGMAWDMQPRYRPDGASIVFTSDRGGGDNLWILPLDGGDPYAVTQEKVRLVTSPTWSPDGGWIAGRKHFTKTRSLGAGEIWLYPLTGGDGLQLTTRPNDQKDLGEPAFSPDGRYVYYSHDATPGSTFQYNKDVNGEIYAIERLDREDGRVERVVGGPGGAIRPTPHPDGRHLAYLRRVRDREVLMVHDLRSGADRAVWDGLDRDLQETWAIHGVYPSMAWLPDGSGLVVWAQGTLWRVDVDLAATGPGTVTEIPFHVKDTREVRDAVRFPVDVAPARFDVKMPRYVTVSPTGDRAVFEALGHLWVRDLPDGAPRRLTTVDDRLESMPAFSRDGSAIAFVTWDDVTLGSIRVLAPGKGKKAALVETVLTPEPGHYADPAFPPDGRTVSYVKTGGGWLTSAGWSADPGLYVIPVAGGAPVRVSREGYHPHFGPDDDVLYFVATGEESAAELRSVDLVDRGTVTLARSAMGVELRVSPDGRWLAFQEDYNAWVAPFVHTGRTIDVGPGSSALPVVQVSKDAGDWLHFSGDGARLHWSTGPDLYTAELAPAFAALEAIARGGPKPDEEAKGLPAEKVALGLSAPLARPEGTVALVGARVVTMNGDEVIDDGTLVWTGDRIVAVGPRADVAVPPGATVLDGAGLTAFPGLVDVHAHGAQADDGVVPEQSWLMQSMLSFGVTTIHDPSNDTEAIFAASERQKAGTLLAPRIFSTGRILYGAKIPGYTATVDDLDDALSHLRRLKSKGAISVKSYNQPRRDQRQMILEAARQLGIMVVPEGGSLLAQNLTQIVDGHTGVEHALPVAPLYDDVIGLWSRTAVGYTPTLGVAYGGIWGELYWYSHTDVWADARLGAFVPPWAIDPVSRRREIAPEEEYNHVDVATSAAALLHAGGRVQLGAHGQREGLAPHWELWMLEQGGMTPHEALRVGSLGGAVYLGLDGDLGSLQPGKLADVAIVEGNPLEDLRRSRDVRYTVVGGRVFDAATMNPVAPAGPPRAAFWWEGAGAPLPRTGIVVAED